MSYVIAFSVVMVCTLILPILLLVVLGVRRKIHALPLAAGFASFFISQIVLRLPILQLLSTQSWFAGFAAHTLAYTVVIGGFTAGLFEETARLVGAGLLKRHRSYTDMLSFGLGHGLCEVILLVGLSQINNVLFSVMLLHPEMAQSLGVSDGLLQTITQQIHAASPWMAYLVVVERVSAVMYHLFATCLVFLAVKRKKPLLYLGAILAHTLFNSVAALLLLALGTALGQTAASLVVEVVLLVLGGLGLGFVRRQKYDFDQMSKFAQSSVN